MQKSPNKNSAWFARLKLHKGSIIGLLLLTLGFVLLDQATKVWSEKSFLMSYSDTDIHDYHSASLHIFTVGSWSNWIQLKTTYLRNTGAAWGLLGNLPEYIRPYFFYFLTIFAMGIILIFYFKAQFHSKLSRLGIAFVFAGASGNLVDRLYFHYVIDWIHFRWRILGWNYDYPVFNIADSAVTIGVILLILETLREEFKNYKLKKAKKS